MVPSISALVIAASVLRFSQAQLTGVLTFDGVNTLGITIDNPTEKNYSVLAPNTLFDRQHMIPYNPITIVDANGTAVNLNGTEFPPDASGLSDINFQALPPGFQYTRQLLLSDYLITSSALALPRPRNTTYIASLPTQVQTVDTTGFTSSDTLATYYLSRGLRPVTITAAPVALNWTLSLIGVSIGSVGTVSTMSVRPPPRMRRRIALRRPEPPMLREIPI